MASNKLTIDVTVSRALVIGTPWLYLAFVRLIIGKGKPFSRLLCARVRNGRWGIQTRGLA